MSGNTWKYLALVFVAVGLFISAYLSYVDLTDSSAVCIEGGAFNCDLVQRSVYSELMGIKIAYLGLGVYLLLGAMLLLENRIPFLQTYGPMMVFGITLFGFLYSVWLIYVQAFRLEAFCPWCLGQEAAMTLLFIASIVRLRQALQAE